jgi:transglycosylase-like protein with SLT domain
MKGLCAVLGLVLIMMLGVPIGLVTFTAVLIAPAISEQIRLDPCSAYDTTTTHLTIRRATTSIVELPRWGTPRHQSLRSPAQAIPAKVKKLYLAAAARYRVPWQLLAAIGMAETRHGRATAVSSAGARGLMQFMPSTFRQYGVDGDHNGRIEINSDADSVFSAAHYLVASGVRDGQAGVIRALWSYNRSLSYRNDVLFYAATYAGTGGIVVASSDEESCVPTDDSIPGFSGASCPRSGSPAERGLQPSALHGLRCVKAAFPAIVSMGGKGGRPIGTSDHPRGLAVDFMIPRWRSTSGRAFGWKLARWVAAHAKQLRVKYIIWDACKWNPAVNTTWRPYRHPFGNANPTLAHRDHVHVSFRD